MSLCTDKIFTVIGNDHRHRERRQGIARAPRDSVLSFEYR